jgi:hypothetical protein
MKEKKTYFCRAIVSHLSIADHQLKRKNKKENREENREEKREE